MYYLDCRFRSGGRDSAVLIRRDGVPYARRAERALWSTAESLLLCGFLMLMKEGQNARPLASACDQDTVLGYRDPIATVRPGNRGPGSGPNVTKEQVRLQMSA